MHEQVRAYTPALTGFVVFFLMGSGERTQLECSREGATRRHYGTGSILPACLPLRPVLRRVREDYESQGVEAYAFLDKITVAAREISPRTVGVVPFLERDLTARGIHLNPSKAVALAPKGHVPTPEGI